MPRVKSEKCFECGGPADVKHHVVPRSLGGTKTISLCQACHSLVHGVKLNHPSLTREALRYKRGAGLVYNGTTEYGKVRNGDILDVDPQQGRVIHVVSRLRSARRWTYQRIADWLNARSIPTAQGRAWYPQTVKRAAVLGGANESVN